MRRAAEILLEETKGKYVVTKTNEESGNRIRIKRKG